jgi:hypothetical protein
MFYARVGTPKMRACVGLVRGQHIFGLIFLCLLSFDQAKESK